MCFESLIDGDAAEKPLRELLRAELSGAVTDGAIAATVVLVLALAGGVGPPLAAGATLATFLLGVTLHQCVLVAGVGLVRWRRRLADGASPGPA